MRRPLLNFLFVLLAVALVSAWTGQIPEASPRSGAEPRAVPVVRARVTGETLTLTLTNQGNAPLSFESYGYIGQPPEETINFTIADSMGNQLAPHFFCGTGLERKMLTLLPGESLTRTYEQPSMLRPVQLGSKLTVVLKTDVKVISLLGLERPVDWHSSPQ